MDKNIFVKKYNPDVNSKYSDKQNSSQDFQKDNINYKKELWKGITGKEFTIDIQKSEDFIIEFENPNFESIRNAHTSEYILRQNEIKEIEQKNKKIREAAMENVMKIGNNLGITNMTLEQTKTHDELKQIQVNENDLLKNEKEQFNELLKNLEGII